MNTIIKRLELFGLDLNDLTYNKDTNTLRYKYWDMLPQRIQEAFPELVIQTIDHDEDCGWLFCYKIKEDYGTRDIKE